MRKLIYGMNLTLDGYIAAPGNDLGWSGPTCSCTGASCGDLEAGRLVSAEDVLRELRST